MKNELTYVLFGSEAIKIYKMSLKLLLSSNYIDYKVGAYSDVKRFMKETEKWESFIEINKNEFLQLKQKLLKDERAKKNKKKKGRLSIFKFFKN